MILRFVHVVVSVNTSLLFMAKEYFVVCTYRSLSSIHPVMTIWAAFHLWGIVNTATMNMNACGFV